MSSKLDTSKIEKRISSDKLLVVLLDDISRRLAKQTDILSKIYGELASEADEGEYLVITDTATTTTEMLWMRDLIGHPSKGYVLKNDGSNNIQVGHNIDISKRYSTVESGEEITFEYNRKKIKSIYIKAESGTSAYRLWIIW